MLKKKSAEAVTCVGAAKKRALQSPLRFLGGPLTGRAVSQRGEEDQGASARISFVRWNMLSVSGAPLCFVVALDPPTY